MVLLLVFINIQVRLKKLRNNVEIIFDNFGWQVIALSSF